MVNKKIKRRPFSLPAGKDGRTQQHFRDECDVNRIVKRFSETGVITHLNKREGTYGFASSQSFQESAFIVAEAKSQFESLPSGIRAHFENDPGKFLECVNDPEREAELIELGLIEPELEAVEEQPPEAPSEPPPAPPEEPPEVEKSAE